jgi:hypothetical protein
MNDKDLRQMQGLMESLEKNGLKGAVVLDVPSTQFVRINLMLLKGLSEDRGLTGMFISVDRPHQYIVHRLSMHQIKAGGLIFIDAISRFSADSKVAAANVGFVDGPFHIDRLPTAMSQWEKGNGSKTKLSDCKFAIIDNLSSLLTYNSFASVELFLRSFVKALDSSGNVIVPLLIDSQKSMLLYEVARSISREEIRVIDIQKGMDNKPMRISDQNFRVEGS